MRLCLLRGGSPPYAAQWAMACKCVSAASSQQGTARDAHCAPSKAQEEEARQREQDEEAKQAEARFLELQRKAEEAAAKRREEEAARKSEQGRALGRGGRAAQAVLQAVRVTGSCVAVETLPCGSAGIGDGPSVGGDCLSRGFELHEMLCRGCCDP